jgi:hypothetical protein
MPVELVAVGALVVIGAALVSMEGAGVAGAVLVSVGAAAGALVSAAAGALVDVSVEAVPVSSLLLQPVRTRGRARTVRQRGVIRRSDFMIDDF